MPNTIPSPNMNMPVPVPGVDPGPDWAINISSCYSILDGHNHTNLSGVQIPSAGININADLPFNSNNATLLRSSRYVSQSSVLNTGADITCVYVKGGDLYYTNAGAVAVQLTVGNSPNAGIGNITGLPSTPNGGAGVAWVNASSTFQFSTDSGVSGSGANIDVGTVIIRYPGSYPTPSGNFIALEAPTTLSTGYAFTLPAATPASSGALLTSTTGGILSYTNVDNSTITITSNQLVAQTVVAGGITSTQIAAGAVGTTQLATAAVGTTQLASNAVTTAKITSGSITTATLASNLAIPGSNVTINSLSAVTMAGSAGSSFKIIRGGVNSSGSLVLGENFSSSRASTGNYVLNFASNQFSGTPVVVGNGSDATGIVFSVTASSSTSANIQILTNAGGFVNAPFVFMAIGPT